jgi:hypothetical protein
MPNSAAPHLGRGAPPLTNLPNRNTARIFKFPVACNSPTGHLAAALHQLQGFRRAIDQWDAAGGAWPLPQPQAHGLDLPDLRPSQIFWPRPTR